MRAQSLLMLGLLLLGMGASVIAQEQPGSAQYHALHNPNSPYHVGSSQQPAPQPEGYWEKTWGAIAPSPVGGVLGAAEGASSKEEAERIALADCEAKGGGACKVELAYYNQCAVMTLGDKYLGTAGAATVEEASRVGIAGCQRTDTNCRIYYSACTKPVFHKF